MRKSEAIAENRLLRKQNAELLAIIRGLNAKLGVEVEPVLEDDKEEQHAERIVLNDEHRARVRARRKARIKRETGAVQYQENLR